MGGVAELPGLDDEDERYFRDVYDHLIRISDLIDSYRDLLTGRDGRLPLHRLQPAQRVMKQLTLIATIFLPLAFITGFFGQNFGWMVRHIGGRRPSSPSASAARSPSSRAAHLLQTPRLVLIGADHLEALVDEDVVAALRRLCRGPGPRRC